MQTKYEDFLFGKNTSKHTNEILEMQAAVASKIYRCGIPATKCAEFLIGQGIKIPSSTKLTKVVYKYRKLHRIVRVLIDTSIDNDLLAKADDFIFSQKPIAQRLIEYDNEKKQAVLGWFNDGQSAKHISNKIYSLWGINIHPNTLRSEYGSRSSFLGEETDLFLAKMVRRGESYANLSEFMKTQGIDVTQQKLRHYYHQYRVY